MNWNPKVENTFWQKQTKQSPLFPDLIWSRPENRVQAGKLLIVGGSGYEFKAPANAYGDALNAGVGNAKVLLPDSMKKIVQDIFPEAEFAPSTPSGSFSRRSLSQLLDLSAWADGALLAGNMGRNSETAVMLESFVEKYHGQLTITQDATEYFMQNACQLLDRPETTLVVSFTQLQKLAISIHFSKAFTFDMGLLRVVDLLHEFSQIHPCNVIVKYLDTVLVACSGQVSSTKQTNDMQSWRVSTAATASVWWLQNPSKPLQALTTSLL